jgi:FMN-dependent NADH-azoreductase
MDNVLFINACIRNNSVSRTYKLADHFIQEYKKRNQACNITELDLKEMQLSFLLNAGLEYREALLEKQDYNNPCFDMARQFAGADKIIIAAPFWDLNFPAILKVYLENICVPNIAFKYTAESIAGMCKADKLVFITTRGGIFTMNDTCNFEMGSRYVQALCKLFGIREYQCLYAEGLDIVGTDVRDLMKEGFQKADEAAAGF